MPDPSSPLVFTDRTSSLKLQRAVRAGQARKLALGLFTYDLKTNPASLVRQHWMEVVAQVCPGAVITDRSILNPVPDPGGFLYVVHSRKRDFRVPGLNIIPRKGPGPLPDDIALPHGLWLASRPRALLENVQPSRATKGHPRRTLSERELHDWIARLLRNEGAMRLNGFRDRARELAETWEMPRAFRVLDGAIGAVLGTRPVESESAAFRAAARGRSFDEKRDVLLQTLMEVLDARAPSPRTVGLEDATRLRMLPFFESYFSNFIEGTEFEVDEAADIVLQGVIPANRPDDAHDILGTYRVVADDVEMSREAQSAEEFLGLLRQRHAQILGARPDKRPGEFKLRGNRAGSTEFVPPQQVEGTLERGFEYLRRLHDPFARAVFTMFLVSEVHPFDDGNGRVARVMMNAELHRASEMRVIIPTVFRNEYLSGLRALTHNAKAEPLIRILDFAQRYTAQLDFRDVETAKRILEKTNALMDSNEAMEKGLRLVLPSSLPS